MDYPFIQFNFPQSTLSTLRITLIGFNLDCDLVHEFFLTVEDQAKFQPQRDVYDKGDVHLRKKLESCGKAIVITNAIVTTDHLARSILLC